MSAVLRTGLGLLEVFAARVRRTFTLGGQLAGAFPEAAGPHVAALVIGTPRPVRASHREQARSGLTMAEAADLLDWLEANGHSRRQLCCLGKDRYAVCWQPAPAPRTSQTTKGRRL